MIDHGNDRKLTSLISKFALKTLLWQIKEFNKNNLILELIKKFSVIYIIKVTILNVFFSSQMFKKDITSAVNKIKTVRDIRQQQCYISNKTALLT